MFVPSFYREPDGAWMAELVRGNPLALAVINGGDAEGPFATHLPVIPDPAAHPDWPGDLEGATLLGHMNRMNPHWEALETGAAILLTFSGPHAYVSPALYEVTPAAPTWNFTAVHVRGTVQKIESVEETLEVVRSTALAFEADFGAGWDQSESLGYFRRIVTGVGAFRVTVTSAKGMFKLSQEQPAEVFERVQKSFDGSECTRHRETARLMGRLPR
ncbi:FMN-binding negative transcriptional regulator [Actinomadura soli]|uniref:FMN-binding negative transcriptional regulator n=1 Tax=Actinomadura soli TaxID=2508997 RepID=A0A5C4JGJ2_9ACTN|nr:FMN-binding negative transcriptional regulator [Actinomadura soli]TMR04953.1 FMN-binding negative transcriptional regulator [Actinomadura soli]